MFQDVYHAALRHIQTNVIYTKHTFKCINLLGITFITDNIYYRLHLLPTMTLDEHSKLDGKKDIHK